MATLLIIDDRAVNRDYLVTLLGYGEHRLLQAADGEEGLAIVRADRPDLVITDVLMPVVDGYEFVRRLRADPQIAQTPVVFCTAHYHEHEARSLASACGVQHVLLKPAEPEEVLRVVAEALADAAPVSEQAPEAAFDRDHLRLITDKLSTTAEELGQANEQLSTLVDLGLQLGSERNPRRLLTAVCEAGRELLGARTTLVAVLDNGRPVLRHLVSSDPELPADALNAADFDIAPLDVVLRERRCVRIPGSEADTLPEALRALLGPSEALLVAPITSPSRAFGWFCFLGKSGAEAFTERDDHLARVLGAQSGRVYENGSLYADLVRQTSELEAEIEERRRAERELERYFTQSINLLCEAGLDGYARRLNPAWEATLGFAHAELLQRPIFSFVHPEDQQATEACIGALRQGVGTTAFENRCQCKDGSYKWILWSVTPLPGQETFFATGNDITERKRLEEQVRQSMKMEAIGRLAGGVAHDFNNLLCIIIGYGDLLQDRFPDGDPTRDLVGEMSAAGKRAASLTRQLLAFSRKAILEPKLLDLRVVLSDLARMLRRIIGEDVELVTEAAAGLGTVRADPSQVEQVLLNLAVNARDAMPQGGTLRIEVRNADLDERSITGGHAVQPGRYVLLAVTDTGCGMNAATLARIWEPFFTTKGEAGTGLGLATVYGIVQQSGGYLGVESQVGSGSTFSIYLPRIDAEVAPAPTPRATSMPPGTETILVVEDAEGVRKLMCDVLERCGYRVVRAANAVEAFQAAVGISGAYDLLVTDVVMPGMAGPEMAARLNERYPGRKTLYLSGYTDDAVVRAGIQQAEVEFLQKPFSPIAFAQKVRGVLDR